ncbi:HNH endonuclease [Myroides sp. C15-4]|uniref:HNH endonuclease n=1 Tax=Myroides sp. C15-4 TaxID=3400532 RepID=UPI003D2F5BF9
MRAVNKGLKPRDFNSYKEARAYLTTRLGYYCSYCEMGTNNMIEVEHIEPVANGGDKLEWDNFLLSCKYCNTNKSNHNQDRRNYFWPDIDNTDLLFEYSLFQPVVVKDSLPQNVKTIANNLIRLTGLDKYPNSVNTPTEADTRWVVRTEVMFTAMESYNDFVEFLKTNPDQISIDRMIRSICRESKIGFPSLWLQVYEYYPLVVEELINFWKERFNTYFEYQPDTTTRVVRPNGQI